MPVFYSNPADQEGASAQLVSEGHLESHQEEALRSYKPRLHHEQHAKVQQVTKAIKSGDLGRSQNQSVVSHEGHASLATVAGPGRLRINANRTSEALAAVGRSKCNEQYQDNKRDQQSQGALRKACNIHSSEVQNCYERG